MTMKKKWKLILGGIVVVIIAAVVIMEATKGIEAKIVTVTTQDIAKTFKEEGQVVADQDLPLHTVKGGKISAIPVHEGDHIKNGDILMTFDSQELVYLLEQLDGELRSLIAQKDQEKSTISIEKMKQLYEIGAISKKEYEDAKNKIESQYYPGLIDSLQARIKSVQHQINENTIFAPKDGIISQLNVKEGQVLLPGAHLMTLFQDDLYQIEVFILTEDVARISKGMDVVLIQDNKLTDVVFSGSVQKIAPSAVEKTSSLGLQEKRVKITIAPTIPKGLTLRPGYALDVEFTIDKQKDQLIVPKTTLFPYEEGDALWIVDDGKAKIQKVVKGFENDKDVVITEGIKEGDKVILNPQLKGLKEGIKITEEVK